MGIETDRPLANWRAPEPPSGAVLSGRFAQLARLDAQQHAGQLHRANSASDAIWDYLPYGPFGSSAGYFRWAKDMSERRDPHFYAIKSLETGRFCGVASYLRIAPEAGSIEVGHINFSPELQRTPAATEAIFLMMQWAFEAGYRRFEWKCDASNMGSRRAAQRFGFSYEVVVAHKFRRARPPDRKLGRPDAAGAGGERPGPVARMLLSSRLRLI